MIFWYAKHKSDFTLEDKIQIGHLQSEKSHSFKMKPETNNVSHLSNKRFVGQVTNNNSHDRTGRNCSAGSMLTFQLKHSKGFQYLLLRREFYAPVFPVLTWTQDAMV